MEHQFHYNRKFYFHKKTGYWISTTLPKIRAHTWVWKNNYGEIEKGYHIHHKDGNKSNNDISNLEIIKATEHLKKYHINDEFRKKSKDFVNKIRHLTKKWHSSEEGLDWHKKHGIKTWEERKPFFIKCLICEKQIETKTYHQKFCNQNCKAKYARRILKNKIN